MTAPRTSTLNPDRVVTILSRATDDPFGDPFAREPHVPPMVIVDGAALVLTDGSAMYRLPREDAWGVLSAAQRAALDSGAPYADAAGCWSTESRRPPLDGIAGPRDGQRPVTVLPLALPALDGQRVPQLWVADDSTVGLAACDYLFPLSVCIDGPASQGPFRLTMPAATPNRLVAWHGDEWVAVVMGIVMEEYGDWWDALITPVARLSADDVRRYLRREAQR